MATKTGVSMELAGKAAVQHTAEGKSSMEIMGKAAVESKGGRSLEIIGKAAVNNNAGSVEIIGRAAVHSPRGGHVRAHFVHFSWTSACLTCTGILCWCVVLFARFVYIWQQCLLTGGASQSSIARASVMLGTEVGLFVMAVLLVLLVPRMIVTWTAALVFKYLLAVMVPSTGGGDEIVIESKKVAKEISWITLTNVFEEGNAAAAVVLVVCFSTTAVLRYNLAV